MIKFPDQIKNSTKVEGYVSTIDLFAAIPDYFGVGEASSDGKSLRGIIDRQDEEHGSLVVSEWLYRGDVEPNHMMFKDGWIVPDQLITKA